mgnify:CR=1 FL=1
MNDKSTAICKNRSGALRHYSIGGGSGSGAPSPSQIGRSLRRVGVEAAFFSKSKTALPFSSLSAASKVFCVFVETNP